jgi:hypothetical protein
MMKEKGPRKAGRQQDEVDSKKSKKKSFMQRKNLIAEKSFFFRLRKGVLIERERGDET